jgi:hypothetical protein
MPNMPMMPPIGQMPPMAPYGQYNVPPPQGIPPQPMPITQPPMMPYAQPAMPNDKDQLGEMLYALVEKKNSANASKITGMLLEMEVDQIQTIIKDPNQLDKWIEEATKVPPTPLPLGSVTTILTLTHHIHTLTPTNRVPHP